jgi:hypothetical protein
MLYYGGFFMRTAQKNECRHSAGFSFLYSFASARRGAAVFVLTLAGALVFTGCDNFIGKQQDEQPVPSFRSTRQSVLTVEPSRVELTGGGIQTFRAKMGGYATGVEWMLSGNVSEGTKMSGNRLIVAEDEEATNLTLRAALNSNRNYATTVTILVTGSGLDPDMLDPDMD